MISIIDPPAWHQQAACRGSNPAAFYPEVGQWTVSANAIAICETCPVAQQCREAGIDEVYGIWGGINYSMRRRDNRRTVAA